LSKLLRKLPPISQPKRVYPIESHPPASSTVAGPTPIEDTRVIESIDVKRSGPQLLSVSGAPQ
jgi:hypothetical protein